MKSSGLSFLNSSHSVIISAQSASFMQSSGVLAYVMLLKSFFMFFIAAGS